MKFSIDNYYLRPISFMGLLNVKEKALVKRKMTKRTYEKQQFIFKERSYTKGVYIVRKGKVKIFQTNPDGKQSIVYIHKKGDFFGHRSMLAAEPHPASAVAMDQVVLSFIPREVFMNLISGTSQLGRQLLLNVSKEFSVWVNKLTVFSQLGVKERVALSLIILNQIYQNDGDESENNISINRDDFAGYVGTAKETLVRMLRYYKDEKIIETRGSKIKILNLQGLYNIVYNI